MSASIKNNRVTVYFSVKKDTPIIKELNGVEAGDVSWFLKELMKDGIKYRNNVNNNNVAPSVLTNTSKVISTDLGASFNDLDNITIQEKNLSLEDAEELFDKL